MKEPHKSPQHTNRFGVDTNNLEIDKIYTLHTREGKFHGKFRYCNQAGACFLTLDRQKLIQCNATQIADYDGR